MPIITAVAPSITPASPVPAANHRGAVDGGGASGDGGRIESPDNHGDDAPISDAASRERPRVPVRPRAAFFAVDAAPGGG